MPEIKTYSGSCHCGAVRFRLKTETITTGVRCNCSICVRKGAVMSSKYFEPHEVEEISGTENLTTYQCSDKVMDHVFCRTCGIYPFHEWKSTYRVNLGCIDDLDVLALEIGLIDGRSF
ncbi:MAG: GFA family protein [Deltaproteobacteria bacterium]|nr:GFA family protein [Deltaproteobacteria bacterium]MBK8011748.1 GFA family protein [Deltaproteobacteria bacterium]